MGKTIATCLALGVASLVLPSEPSYDPLAWLIWGRELAHLGLDTSGGPSWKPLPVVFTTLFAPFGEVDRELPAAMWMALSRAGVALALAFAFRLAQRLGGGGQAGVLGGAVAVAAVALTPDWFQFAAQGSEAPLAVALMLWAVERHLDSHAGHALALGTLACLMRPELVPFLVVYGAWAAHTEPRLRPYAGGALALLVAAWVVPDWVASGVPFDGGVQARSEPAWSLSLAEHPWLRALERVHNHAGLPVELLGALAVGVAVARRRWAVPALAAAAVAEAGLFVAMTQAGFSGNPRYVMPALAIWAVLAGVGAAELAKALPALSRRSTMAVRVAGAAVAAVSLALVAHGFADTRVVHLRAEAHEVGVRMQVHRDLARAVQAAGGPAAVRATGSATANRALQTRLAWEIGVPTAEVERLTDERLVFRSSREPLVGKVYLHGRARTRRTIARVGTVRVYRRDGLTFPIAAREWRSVRLPFTPLLQGIHTSAPRGGTGGVSW